MIETSLNCLLFKRDVEMAKSFVRSVIQDLYLDRVDMSKLVITKSITKAESKYLTKQAHVELAEKMRKRDPNNAFRIGDRVAYVIIKGSKGMPAYEKSEDPLYVLENSLSIDIEHYIEHQLSKPIHRLFEPVMDNVSELLHGDHTRITKAAATKGPMSMFVTTSVVCVGCKKGGSILCSACDKNYIKHFRKLEDEIEKKKITFSRCWSECQRCQNSLCNEVLCVNRDCPIFYMRTKVMKELGDNMDKFEKLRELQW